MKSLYIVTQNSTFKNSVVNLFFMGIVSLLLSACAAEPSSSVPQTAAGKKVCTVNEPAIGSNVSKHHACRIITEEEQRQIDQQAQDMANDQINRSVAARGSN